MADQALEGLRVVELGDFISAAYAGKLLADLGADVVKVEPPEGDSLRWHGPFRDDRPDAETSALHLFLDANKRGVRADLETAKGRERLLALVAAADVVVHNLAPARLEALGLTYDELAGGRRDLVMVSITPFGYDTPHRDWRGPALVTMAASGLMQLIGDPGRSRCGCRTAPPSSRAACTGPRPRSWRCVRGGSQARGSMPGSR